MSHLPHVLDLRRGSQAGQRVRGALWRRQAGGGDRPRCTHTANRGEGATAEWEAEGAREARSAQRSGKVRGEAGEGRRGAASSARCTHHLLVALGLLGELGHVDVVGAGHAAEGNGDDLKRGRGGGARAQAADLAT